MNSSPVITGAVAVSTGMIASIVQWLAGLAHLSMPPEVSGAIAALVLWAAHMISTFIEVERAPKEPDKQADAPK